MHCHYLSLSKEEDERFPSVPVGIGAKINTDEKHRQIK